MELDYHTKHYLTERLREYISPERWQRLLEVQAMRTRHLTVVLEDLFQPHNASAVVRTCDCFGIQDLHIIENRNTYDINPEIVVGSNKWVNLIKYNQYEHNTLDCFEMLRLQGYRIVATTPHKDDCLLQELPIEQKTALIFGTERQGLSKLAMEHADAFVKIPMFGLTESFNISVSAALCLHHLTDRLHKMDIPWQLQQEEKIDLLLDWAMKSVKKPESYLQLFLQERE
jgi:tRNA (guanosine-2'-O-)-methyltransferase